MVVCISCLMGFCLMIFLFCRIVRLLLSCCGIWRLCVMISSDCLLVCLVSRLRMVL